MAVHTCALFKTGTRGKHEGKLEGVFWLTESHPWSLENLFRSQFKSQSYEKWQINWPFDIKYMSL